MEFGETSIGPVGMLVVNKWCQPLAYGRGHIKMVKRMLGEISHQQQGSKEGEEETVKNATAAILFMF